jgi:hypothetical protein
MFSASDNDTEKGKMSFKWTAFLNWGFSAAVQAHGAASFK